MAADKNTTIRIAVLAGAMILIACYILVRSHYEQLEVFSGSKAPIGGGELRR